MATTRELAVVSLLSGALSIGGFVLVKKYLCSKCCTKKCDANKKIENETKFEQSKIYEEKALLDQYMLFNFAEANEFLLFDLGEFSDIRNCFNFPQKVALLCREYCPDIFFFEDAHQRSALDVGCAVGRSCFELSKLFHKVIGIDYSQNFINQCKKIIEEKTVTYECTLEGNLNQKLFYKLDADVKLDRIEFEVGDACCLRDDLGEFDLVLASNLICRLGEPMKFLNRLKDLVKPSGYAILSTPFTWGAQYTPQSNWLGGYVDSDGKEVTGLDGLKASLSDAFELKHCLNHPMIIRETKRKFQFTICLITIWQRK